MNNHMTIEDDFLNQLAGLKPMDTQVDLAEVFYAAGFAAAEASQQPRIFNRLATGLLVAVVLLMIAIPVSYQIGSRHGYSLARNQSTGSNQRPIKNVPVERERQLEALPNAVL